MKNQNLFVQAMKRCFANEKISVFLVICILLFNSCKQKEDETTATNEDVTIAEEPIKNATKSIENSTNTTSESSSEQNVYLKILEKNFTLTSKEFAIGSLKFGQSQQYNSTIHGFETKSNITLEQNYNTAGKASPLLLIVFKISCDFKDESCLDISCLLDNYPKTLTPNQGSLEIGFLKNSLDGQYKLMEDNENEIILESAEISNSKIMNFKGHYKLKFIKNGVNSNPEIITIEGKCIYK
ncbi:MAG TPA: hypothetical protein PK431_13775 [Chitinophagales bacterium]|nr:hypothetical protein [Chitinophagales bacterium]